MPRYLIKTDRVWNDVIYHISSPVGVWGKAPAAEQYVFQRVLKFYLRTDK